MASRTRVKPYRGAVGGVLGIRIRDYYWNTVSQDTRTVADNVTAFSGLKEIQITESESHPYWKSRKRGAFRGDVGGPFRTERRWAKAVNADTVSLGAVMLDPQIYRETSVSYRGPVLPMAPGLLAFPPFLPSSEVSLNELGTTAISRCAPTNPTADTSVFVKELLSEGFPHMFVQQLKNLKGMTNSKRRKAIASSYLNLEFGWKPFISDINKMWEAITKAEAIMAQHSRDSGRVVRRSYYFPDETVESSTTIATNCSPWYNPSNNGLEDDATVGKGKVVCTKTTTTKSWFKGAFTYYVPSEGGSSSDRVAREVIRARKLLGLSLTPDAIWNMMPWSWAVDWFSNTSDVLKNWTAWAVDNQVLQYGYMMQHTLQEWTYTYVGPTGFKTRDVRVPSVTLCCETKIRVRATPYGFGLDFSAFSGRQKAIVAALGLSRGK